MHTVAKATHDKVLRAACAVCYQTLRELSHFADARGSTVVRERWPRLGIGLRELTLLMKFIALWHSRSNLA
ncbi:MAG: hypothetical protein NT154_36460 [Verrucomicrobia bacterium]|nr:hypothetical protein [Verrucomicrobiota bacterium]